jgi:hypothetical protein
MTVTGRSHGRSPAGISVTVATVRVDSQACQIFTGKLKACAGPGGPGISESSAAALYLKWNRDAAGALSRDSGRLGLAESELGTRHGP